jgi:hypothetical protein
VAILAHVPDGPLYRLTFAGSVARGVVFRRWSATFDLRLQLGETLTFFGDRLEHPFGELLEAMQRADVVRHATKNLSERLGREEGAIGGDAPQRHVTRLQGALEPTQKRPDVLVVGIVVSDFREDALVAAILHGGQQTKRTIIACIGRSITRKSSERPIDKRRVQAGGRLFFPRLPPRVGWWHRGQTPGGPATGANVPGGRASRPRPPGAPPDR